MQELRAQIQAQLKLAATLRQMADAAGRSGVELEGLDIGGDLVSSTLAETLQNSCFLVNAAVSFSYISTCTLQGKQFATREIYRQLQIMFCI